MKHGHGFNYSTIRSFMIKVFLVWQLISDLVVLLDLHFVTGLRKYCCPRNDWKL